MSVGQARVAIVVLAMPGCPACTDFKPRFERQVEGFKSHGVPFVWYDQITPIQRYQIPVMIVDATSKHESVQALCDQHQVSGMPTTLLLVHNSVPYKAEGSISDQEIYDLLVSAAQANR